MRVVRSGSRARDLAPVSRVEPRAQRRAPGSHARSGRRPRRGPSRSRRSYADGMNGSYPGTAIQRGRHRGGFSTSMATGRAASIGPAVADESRRARSPAEKVVGLSAGPHGVWPACGSAAWFILGDARSPSMQSHMNLKIKFREGFRPFAPYGVWPRTPSDISTCG